MLDRFFPLFTSATQTLQHAPPTSQEVGPSRPHPDPHPAPQLPAPRSGGASGRGGAVPPREAQGQRWREAAQWGLGLGGPPKKGARYTNDLHVHSGIITPEATGFRGGVEVELQKLDSHMPG